MHCPHLFFSLFQGREDFASGIHIFPFHKHMENINRVLIIYIHQRIISPRSFRLNGGIGLNKILDVTTLSLAYFFLITL